MRHLLNSSRPAARRRTAPFQRLGAAALGAAALSLLGLSAAHAQTYTYEGQTPGTTSGPTTGNFTNGFNDGTNDYQTPVSSATTGLVFGGTTAYTATDDLASELDIDSLSFTNTSAVTVAQGAGTTLTEAANTSIALGNTGTLNFGLNLANSGFLTTFSGMGSGTFGGVLSGAGGVTQSGSGTVTLSNANTYNGATTVNSGALVLGNQNAAQNSALTLNGGALYLGFSTGFSGFSPNIALTANSTLGLASTEGQDNDNGTITGGGNALTINNNGDGNALYLNGNVNNVSQINVASGALGFTFGSGNQGGGSPINVANGATLQTYSGGTDTSNITLNGGNGVNGSGALRNQGYGPTSIFSGTVALASGNSGIGTDGGNITLSGVVSGSGSLTKLSNNTLTVSGANTYTGSTTVNAGTLTFQSAYQSNALSIASGAVLELNVASGTTDDPTSTFTGTGTLQKTGGGTLQWGQGAATFSLGAGSLIDVEGGTFIGGSYGNENWTNNKSSLNIASGATFDGVEAATNFDALTGAGTLQGGYGGTVTTTIGVAGGSGTFSGIIQNSNNGTLSLNKVGAGNETLSNFNTFTGGTTVNGGTLTLAAGGSGGTVQGVVNVNSGALLSLTAGDALGYNDGQQVTMLNINGGTVDNATGSNEGYHTSLNLTGGTLTSSGGGYFNINAGDDGGIYGITSNASATTSLISSGINVRGGNLNFNVASGTTPSGVDLNVTGPIINNAITKTGSGVLALSNAGNSYGGSTTINGGILSTNNLNSNGSNSDIGSGTDVILNGGTLQYTGGGNNYGNSFNRNITVGANGGTLDIGAGQFFFYQGSLSGSGSFAKSGANQLILNSNSPNFSGNFTINSGEVQVRNTNNQALGTGAVFVANGADLSTGSDGGGTASIANNITLMGGNGSNGSGALQANDGIPTTYTGTVNLAGSSSVGSNSNTNFTISGPVTGSAGATLTKVTGNTVTLSGANTYTGGTTITGGTLALAAASADSSGPLSVGNGTVVQTGVSNALGGGAVTLTAGTLQNTDLTANDSQAAPHPGVSNDTQNSGTLTLGNGASILDFGAGNTGAIFDFANSSLASWTGTLSVYDYSGLYPSGSNAATSMYTTGGGGLDQLFFGTDSTGLTAAQLGDITFYSDNGKTLYPGGSAVILSDGEVVAAPEPSAWAGLGLTAFGIGGLVLKARKRKQTEMAA